MKRYDAVGNTTCYAYDVLHRVTSITYPSGSYAANTPTKTFVYDVSTASGFSLSNVAGAVALEQLPGLCLPGTRPGGRECDVSSEVGGRGKRHDCPHEQNRLVWRTPRYRGVDYLGHPPERTLLLSLRRRVHPPDFGW